MCVSLAYIYIRCLYPPLGRRTKHSQTQKNFISEGMLPSFLDMVIWVRAGGAGVGGVVWRVAPSPLTRFTII